MKTLKELMESVQKYAVIGQHHVGYDSEQEIEHPDVHGVGLTHEAAKKLAHTVHKKMMKESPGYKSHKESDHLYHVRGPDDDYTFHSTHVVPHK